MNYIYLYPNYNEARTACKKLYEMNMYNATFVVSDLLVTIGDDSHKFIVVPISMDRERILGLAGICNVDAILDELDQQKTIIKAEKEFMKSRMEMIKAREVK